MQEPEAYDLLVNYAIYQCARVSSGASPCFNVCTTVCAGGVPPSGDPCVTCLDTELDKANSACVSAGVQNCANDFECWPLIECVQGCPQ